MDKVSETAMLLDFYGGLLTQKQRYCMKCHYEQDLSLSEIAEELNISRQGAYDLIKRSEKILKGYEDELGLVERFLCERKKLKLIKQLVLGIECNENHSSENIKKAIGLINELIET